MNVFWMVLKENSNYTAKRHETFDEAKAEAKKLCKKENTKFLILRAIGEFTPEINPVFQYTGETEDDSF